MFAGVGCNTFTQQLRDLEDVPIGEPDGAKLWANVDGHPNVVRVCADGVACNYHQRVHFYSKNPGMGSILSERKLIEDFDFATKEFKGA